MDVVAKATNAANVAALQSNTHFAKLRMETEAADAERERARREEQELADFDAALAAAGWADAYDRGSGMVYYYHHDGRTSWTPPDLLVQVEVPAMAGSGGEATPLGRTASPGSAYTPTMTAVKAMKQRARRDDAISAIASANPEAAGKLESLAKARTTRKGRAAPTRRKVGHRKGAAEGAATKAKATLPPEPEHRPLPAPPSSVARSIHDDLPPTPQARDPHANRALPPPPTSGAAAVPDDTMDRMLAAATMPDGSVDAELLQSLVVAASEEADDETLDKKFVPPPPPRDSSSPTPGQHPSSGC